MTPRSLSHQVLLKRTRVVLKADPYSFASTHVGGGIYDAPPNPLRLDALGTSPKGGGKREWFLALPLGELAERSED